MFELVRGRKLSFLHSVHFEGEFSQDLFLFLFVIPLLRIFDARRYHTPGEVALLPVLLPEAYALLEVQK
jgi:hypothetical protein